MNDLTRGDPDPTGLPANAIQAPLQDLRESVTQLLYILSVVIQKGEQESAFYMDAAYSAGVTSTQLGPGRRPGVMAFLRISYNACDLSRFFLWQKIADMLQVVSTIQRRCKEFGLVDKFESYSDITDNELN